MKFSFTHDGLPCELEAEPTPAPNDPPVDIDDDGMPCIYLDLGHPDEPLLAAGPRIACCRMVNRKGWRIILHADGGDSFAVFDISDATKDEPPMIAEVSYEKP